MAQQDFIGQKGPSKKNPYKKQQEIPAARFSLKNKFILLCTVILIALFGYGLWSLKNTAPAETTETKKEKVKKTEKTAVVLPEKHEEKWQFMQDLKHKEVEQSEYESNNNKHPDPYDVRCASFKSNERAQSLKAQIAFTGIAAKVKKVGSWYRVYSGPYESKRLAQNDINKLKRNKIDCKIF